MAGIGGQEPRFQTRADEVLVPVAVMRPDGKPVDGLRAQDFVVRSDGAVQTVRLLASSEVEPLPIQAVLVIDTGEGSGAALDKIRKTASVVSSYITNDMDIRRPSEAAVVTTGKEIRVERMFTSDAGLLDDTFDKLEARGGPNRIIDGVNRACDLLLGRTEPARRVIVLISETRDDGSKAHFAEVAQKAQRDAIGVYTISYSAFTTPFTQKGSDVREGPDEPGSYNPNNHGGVNLLAIPMLFVQLAKTNVSEAFAQVTGASHAKFTRLRGLETQLMQVGTEIHTSYTLTFARPDGQKSGYHALDVTLRDPRGWHVYARPGYWTGPE